jgi:hypothetical protein
MRAECAGPRGTDKPLQVAVDGMPSTTEATQRPGGVAARPMLETNQRLYRSRPDQPRADEAYRLWTIKQQGKG